MNAAVAGRARVFFLIWSFQFEDDLDLFNRCLFRLGSTNERIAAVAAEIAATAEPKKTSSMPGARWVAG
jgi:hypothetical protein